MFYTPRVAAFTAVWGGVGVAASDEVNEIRMRLLRTLNDV